MNIAIWYADLRSEHCYRNRKTFSSKKVYLSVVRAEREREATKRIALRARCQNERIGESIGNVPLEPEIFFLSILHWAVYGVVRGYRGGGRGEDMKGVGERRTKVI